jgi:SpoIIAA-like
MIEKIPGLPPNVLGYTAKGTVTDEDYQTIIIPEVEECFARQGKVRFLYHIGEEAEGFETAAMWDDAKLGFKHFKDWEKIAVVTDIGWIRLAIKGFGLAMWGKVRVFHNKELAHAVHWISEA